MLNKLKNRLGRHRFFKKPQPSLALPSGQQGLQRLLKRAILVFPVVLVLGIGYFLGSDYRLTQHRAATADPVVEVRLPQADAASLTQQSVEQVDVALFWTIWDRIRSEHIEGPGETDTLVYGAINGMLQKGYDDPFSVFIEPRLNELAESALQGNFSGVGIELESRGGVLTIVTPIVGTPGEKAGLQPGDEILTVDGEDMEGLTTTEAVLKIRGEIGTEVVLGIRRFAPGEGESGQVFDVPVVRDTINVPSVRWEEVEPGIVRLQITSFAFDTPDEWRTAVSEILALDTPLRGILLDLRNNAGGVMSVVPEVMSDFVRSGVVVEHDIGGERQKLEVYGNGRLYDVPAVVLINRGSASASEMVAGAMRDFERGQLIGETTFGKGVIQQVFEVNVPGVENSGSIRLVTARWFTPNGTDVTGVGLVPDILISRRGEEGAPDPFIERGIGEIELLLANGE